MGADGGSAGFRPAPVKGPEHHRPRSLASSLLAITLWSGAAVAYDYPVDSPFAATIIGTPAEFQASLPTDLPLQELSLDVLEDRAIPEILWYHERFKYALLAQDHAAPLVFTIAGTGSSYGSGTMRILQGILFQAGFHVISLSSSTHPNFVAAASATGLPGHLEEDSRDIYHVMERIWTRARPRVEATGFHLAGFSLGAVQAAFVARLDSEQKTFGFDKVLMINPPVSLYDSAVRFDQMLRDNLPGGPDGFSDFLRGAMRRFTEVYKTTESVEFNDDFLYTAYRKQSPDDTHLAAVIGLSFRLASANMIFTADVMNSAGYIVPKGVNLRTQDSLTDYFRVAARTSFLDYFHELLLPRYQSSGLTAEQLRLSLSIRSIEDYLRSNRRIGLMTNADDPILSAGDLAYLTELFGERARIYPKGGHGGNIEHRDNAQHIADFFKN